MPRIPIIMPQLGESIAEATIVRLPFALGDTVDSDQDIIEVETHKAAMAVTSPCRGVLIEIIALPQQSYPVGAILAYLEVDAQEADRLGLLPNPALPQNAPSSTPVSDSSRPASTAPTRVEPTVSGLPVPASARGASYLSPRLKARMQELGLHAADLAGVAGSGAAGRVTIDDFEKFLSKLEEHQMSQASSMRVAVADAMRRSSTRPLATVGRSVTLDPLLAHRRSSDPKPGPALYLLRALAVALSENSAPAGRLIGDKIVHPKSIDIGFAVEVEDGVLVPVLRQADQFRLSEMVDRYNELVAYARARRLPAIAQGGSIATVTNFGTFGLEWATPIPLPEQTLVLGLGAGRVEPRWDSGQKQFLPSTESQMTLSFDHRVLDGGGAGRLLQRIAELLQNPAQL
jgi:pyruvate/2-oxoglutarate dehydrogenase complex dihydrolipoamide acyltransferase (E2) component